MTASWLEFAVIFLWIDLHYIRTKISGIAMPNRHTATHISSWSAGSEVRAMLFGQVGYQQVFNSKVHHFGINVDSRKWRGSQWLKTCSYPNNLPWVKASHVHRHIVVFFTMISGVVTTKICSWASTSQRTHTTRELFDSVTMLVLSFMLLTHSAIARFIQACEVRW